MKLTCNCKKYYEIFSNKHRDKHLFDSWTFIHINDSFIIFNLLHVFYNKNISFYITIIIGILWEIIENNGFGKYFFGKLDYDNYECDTIINSIGDIIADIFGSYLGYFISKLKKFKSLIILIIIIILDLIPYYLSGESNYNIIIKFIKKI